MGLDRMQTGTASHGLLAGSNLPSRFPIAAGWCSPALPTKVYERSKPSGPSTFISQLSLAQDPMMDTRQSPGPIIVQSGQAIFYVHKTGSKPMNVAMCRVRRRAPGSKRTAQAIAVPATQASGNGPSQFLLKGAWGRSVFSGGPGLPRLAMDKVKAVTLVML